MKTKKIILLLLFTFLIIGVAYAANVPDFKAPNGLHKSGTSNFIDEKGHNIQVMEDTDSSHKAWFENNTGSLVQKYDKNDSFYLYADSSEVDPSKAEAVGILEVVECDGNKYIIASWTPKDDKKDMELVWENLLEFNKLNKLTPIKI